MPYSRHIKISFSEILPNRISELIFDENKLNAAKGFWEVGLKDLVKELPDFDRVIDGLRRELRGL